MYIRCFLILAWSHMICKQHKVSHNILSAGPGPMRPRGHSNTKIENPEVIQSQTPKYPKIQKSSKNIPKSQSPKIKTKQKSQNPKIQNQYIIKSQIPKIPSPKSHIINA